jgi:hypothetical protein
MLGTAARFLFMMLWHIIVSDSRSDLGKAKHNQTCGGYALSSPSKHSAEKVTWSSRRPLFFKLSPTTFLGPSSLRSPPLCLPPSLSLSLSLNTELLLQVSKNPPTLIWFHPLLSFVSSEAVATYV